MATPELVVFVDGSEWTRVRPPEAIAPRDWILGVVAVQVTVENHQATALVRANVTGAAPEVRALGSSLVQVALVERGRSQLFNFRRSASRIESPKVEKLTPSPSASVALHLDDALVDEIALPPERLAAAPPPRAFGHVFCRWLRSGAIEPGFDLTDFLSLPPGAKYERRVSRPLSVGAVVSYTIAID